MEPKYRTLIQAALILVLLAIVVVVQQYPAGAHAPDTELAQE
ncbi:MAG TPA: hypothetical protein VKG92_06635 [Flavobacteriales bacterium]|nr:hypothetical protein [Flavobacteriales bacterium]